jgi:hypothetical protein
MSKTNVRWNATSSNVLPRNYLAIVLAIIGIQIGIRKIIGNRKKNNELTITAVCRNYENFARLTIFCKKFYLSRKINQYEVRNSASRQTLCVISWNLKIN